MPFEFAIEQNLKDKSPLVRSKTGAFKKKR